MHENNFASLNHYLGKEDNLIFQQTFGRFPELSFKNSTNTSVCLKVQTQWVLHTLAERKPNSCVGETRQNLKMWSWNKLAINWHQIFFKVQLYVEVLPAIIKLVFFFQNFFKTRFSNTTEKIVCVTVITTEPGHAIEYFESPQIRIQSLPVPQECANEETTRQSELIAGSNNSD